MNFRNRTLVVTIRILLGLFILMSGVTGLMAGPEMHTVPAPMAPTMMQLWDMGIFQLIKITEVVVGIMLVLGFLPALALLFLAPICVGVIVYNTMVAPAYVTTGVIVTLLTIYLGYAYWDKYKAIFADKKLNS